MIRTLLILGRVSNLPTVWTNCLLGWFLAGGAWDLRLAWVAAGGSLLYAGGMYLNDACDVEFDKAHCPERPIPAGKISRGPVVAMGAGLLVGGAILLWRAGPGNGLLVLGLAGAIVLYDLIHKRWKGAVLLMGACRLFLVAMAGGVAAEGAIVPEVWIAAGGLFVYIVGLTVSARGESTSGKASAWSHTLLFAPVAAWLALGPSWTGAAFAALFTAWFAFAFRRLRRASPAGVGAFVGAMLAGIVLADALLISTVGAGPALICAAFLPVNLFLQRYVPAT